MKKLFLTILSLLPTTTFAHSGHLPNEAVHGFLHVEHIVVIAAIALIAYFISTLHGK
jgi:hypothetical protein